MSVVVIGFVYADKAGRKVIPTPLGPFADTRAAYRFMAGLAPLYGSYQVVPLHAPADARKKAGR